jgi:hypothetical protein
MRIVALALCALLTSRLAAQPNAAQPAPKFPAWNIAYAIPTDWRLTQQQPRVHALTNATNDALLYLAPGPYQSFEEVAAELPKAFTALGMVGMPNGAPQTLQIAGMRAMSATYLAQDRTGARLDVKVIAALTPHGTGLVALGLARMGSLARLAPAMDQAMAGMLATGTPVPDAQAIAALRGRWVYYSGRAAGGSVLQGSSSRSYEETVEFDGVGRFTFSSSASVSVTTPETGGVGGGSSAGGVNANSDQGSYAIIGSTLVLRGRAGVLAVDVQVAGDRIIADGKTYFLERR